MRLSVTPFDMQPLFSADENQSSKLENVESDLRQDFDIEHPETVYCNLYDYVDTNSDLDTIDIIPEDEGEEMEEDGEGGNESGIEHDIEQQDFTALVHDPITLVQKDYYTTELPEFSFSTVLPTHSSNYTPSDSLVLVSTHLPTPESAKRFNKVNYHKEHTIMVSNKKETSSHDTPVESDSLFVKHSLVTCTINKVTEDHKKQEIVKNQGQAFVSDTDAELSEEENGIDSLLDIEKSGSISGHKYHPSLALIADSSATSDSDSNEQIDPRLENSHNSIMRSLEALLPLNIPTTPDNAYFGTSSKEKATKKTACLDGLKLKKASIDISPPGYFSYLPLECTMSTNTGHISDGQLMSWDVSKKDYGDPNSPTPARYRSASKQQFANAALKFNSNPALIKTNGKVAKHGQNDRPSHKNLKRLEGLQNFNTRMDFPIIRVPKASGDDDLADGINIWRGDKKAKRARQKVRKVNLVESFFCPVEQCSDIIRGSCSFKIHCRNHERFAWLEPIDNGLLRVASFKTDDEIRNGVGDGNEVKAGNNNKFSKAARIWRCVTCGDAFVCKKGLMSHCNASCKFNPNKLECDIKEFKLQRLKAMAQPRSSQK